MYDGSLLVDVYVHVDKDETKQARATKQQSPIVFGFFWFVNLVFRFFELISIRISPEK